MAHIRRAVYVLLYKRQQCYSCIDCIDAANKFSDTVHIAGGKQACLYLWIVQWKRVASNAVYVLDN